MQLSLVIDNEKGCSKDCPFADNHFALEHSCTLENIAQWL